MSAVASVHLTERQVDALVLRARGFTDRQISVHLLWSYGTVIREMQCARDSYGVPTTAACLALAIRDGFICFDGEGKPIAAGR
jgi:DNA-binding NarL/FixJ family response regulator